MAESPETSASPVAPAAHAAPDTPASPATRATHEAPAGGERVAHVGLVGLGSMGRNVFRLLHDSTDLRLEAVSDAAPPATLTYLLRFDTLLGRFPAPITLDGDVLRVGGQESQGRQGGQGRRVRLLPGKPPGEIPWGQPGIDTVIDAGAGGRCCAEIERHLAAGARRVFLTSPPAEAPDITVAMGVNDRQLRREHRIVCNAGATAQAAAPIAKILHDAFGIRRAILTTIHSYTDDQRLADVPADEPRRGRAAPPKNIIPVETGDAAALIDLLPELSGKLTGLAMNVPVANGSVADLVCWHERPAAVEEVNRVLREAIAALPGHSRLRGQRHRLVRHPAQRGVGHLRQPGDHGAGRERFQDPDLVRQRLGVAHRLIDLIRRFQEIDARENGDAKEHRP